MREEKKKESVFRVYVGSPYSSGRSKQTSKGRGLDRGCWLPRWL